MRMQLVVKMSSTLVLFLLVLKSATSSLCPHLQDCDANAGADAEFLHDFESHSVVPSPFPFLELKLLSKDSGTYQLHIDVNDALRPIKKVLLQLCGANTSYFISSRDVITSTCNTGKDLVVIKNCESSDLYVSVFSTSDQALNIRYFIQDLINTKLYSGQLLLEPSKVKSFRKMRTKRTISNMDSYFIVAAQYSIARASLDGQRSIVLSSNASNTRAIDYDFRQSVMYWTDVDQQVIMRSYLNGSSKVALLSEGLHNPDGVAVDWINNKIYFTDSALDIVGVFDPVSFHYRVLARSEASAQPRAIVLDPINRMMYWSDWGSVARIEKASMDGSGRVVIHNTSLTWPNALTLDIPSQTLYWADASLDRVESSGVDGSNRRLITDSGVSHPFGMVMHNNVLYFSDWSDSTIRSIRSNGSSASTAYSLFSCGRPSGIQIVDQLRQISAPNPCEPGNGGCSHLCLLSTASGGFTCACPDGMTLQGNTDCVDSGNSDSIQPQTVVPGSCKRAGFTTCCSGSSCSGSPANCYCDSDCSLFEDCCSDVARDCNEQGAYLIVASQSSVMKLSMNGIRQRVVISNLTQGRAIDYDFRRNFFYWTDTITRQIMRANLDGSQVTTLLRRGLEEPDGLAVDWVNNKLYFTDMELNIVGVFDPVRFHYLVLVRTGSLSEPRAIVVDSGNRMMYWSDWGSVARIEKASMDGSGRVTIHSANLTWPNALTLDIPSQTLYWADANLDKVESSRVDGSNRQLITSSGIGHPFAIAVKDMSLYFTDWQPNSIRQITHLRGSGVILHTPPSCAQPFGIQVVDKLKQPLTFNPCEPGNGGCSHLCLLSTASVGFACACPDGMTLQGNTTCVEDTSVSSPVQPQEVTPGSCVMAGYGGTCCSGTSCQGSTSLDTCYCDARCQIYRDCCSDACIQEQPTLAPVIQFQTRPSDLTVNESSTATFQCALVSPPPPEAMIQWWLTMPGAQQRQLVADQQGPRNANYTVLVSTGSLSLVIQSVYFTQNQENYTCRVQLGSMIEEASAILTVLFPPRSLEIIGESNVRELSPLTLSCTVKASPAPVITWLRRREGEVTVLLNTTRTTITSQYNFINATAVSILRIERAEPADQGEFICQASNEVRTNTVASAKTVRIPAYNDCVSSRPLCQNGGECIDLVGSFSCTCTSDFAGNSCQLIINQVNDTSSRPVFQESPSSINPDLISPVNLTCTAEGSPAPSYLWYKDGVLIAGETREYLYIEETQPEDRGNYTCVAINEGGQVESDPARLKITGLYQYNVSLLFQAEASNASLENLLLMIASSNIPGTPASVYSVDIIDKTR